MKCAAHPDVDTNLRCGKCGKPMCQKCMVETPVGAKCRACARPYKLPTYRVSSRYYLRATGAAFGMAVICGVAWVALDIISPFFVDLLLAPAAGVAIGEVISRSVNRKRGTGLAVIAGAAVVLSFLITVFLLVGGFHFDLFNILELLAVGLGVYFAANRLR